MVASVVLGMLCVHLLCFCVMLYLISTRLHGKKMGMEIFALGNLFLGVAYILQLLDGTGQAGAVSIINHTFTLSAPVLYFIGAAHFFNHPLPLWKPLWILIVVYSALQIGVQWMWGVAARHALLAATCTLLFLNMASIALYGARTFAKDLRMEMWVFAGLIGGICVLNAAKFALIVTGGMEALSMGNHFQTVFYLYMSFLGTVIPPSVVWLVLRRLTDELSAMASQDPLTHLLNRRGLTKALEAYFRSRHAQPAHLLIIDIDHFKSINDTYGHQVGDIVLCHIAQVLKGTIRAGDLICRLGGEEFMVVCLDTDQHGALLLAERLRSAIAHSTCFINIHPGHIRCTATLGVSASFGKATDLDQSLQQADSALYRGKKEGRNRVESLVYPAMAPAAPSNLLAAQD